MEVKKSIVSIKNITTFSMKMFFRDKRAIFFSLFLPLMIMSIFGVMNFDQATKVKIGIVDESGTEGTSRFTDSLKKIDILTVTEGDLNREKSDLEKGDLDMVLVLPKDFGMNVLESKVTGKPPQAQKLVLLYNEGKQESIIQTGTTVLNQVFDRYTHEVTKTPDLFTLDKQAIVSRNLTFVDFLLPGIVALSIMQMGIFGVVGSFVNWREKGIFRRLLATPVRPTAIIFGQVFTRLILSMLQVTVILLAGVIIFKVHIVGLPLIFLLALLGGTVFLNFGFAVSGIANSQNTVMVLANLIMMPQMFMSGVFFPRDALPDWLYTITAYFPLTYLADAMRNVMIEGKDLFQIWGDVLGLVVWAVVSFIIATRFFRWE